MGSIIEAKTWQHASPTLSFACVRCITRDAFIAPAPVPEESPVNVARHVLQNEPHYWPLEPLDARFTPGKHIRLDVNELDLPVGGYEISFVDKEGDPVPPGTIDYLGEPAKWGWPIVSIAKK